jgi:hypothetical protein
MVTSANNLGDIVQFREDMLLSWLEAFSSQYTNLIMDSF